MSRKTSCSRVVSSRSSRGGARRGMRANRLITRLVTAGERSAFLGSDSGQAFPSGAWGRFAVIVAMAIFNTVLGEELLFRGLLLPRMNGAFGRWDWVANGVLFAAYHLHVPWTIPANLIDTFILAYPAKRYRSTLIPMVVHSAQSVVFLSLALVLVLR